MAQMSARLDVTFQLRQELMYNVYFGLIVGKMNKFSKKLKLAPSSACGRGVGGKNKLMYNVYFVLI